MNVDETLIQELEAAKKTAYRPKRLPVSVYRLQFNEGFKFKDAAQIVPYLNELGITDCYASPYFKSRRGSQHGYDISDHGSLNPELGSEKEFLDFVDALKSHNMGQLLDFVPNHMSIFDNPKWNDVLENGPSSIYSRFFDIDWKPAKAELHNKVLLPILEDLYGSVLERGQISLGQELGAFSIEYGSHRLPLGPKTIVPLLESSLGRCRRVMGDSHPDLMELESIITASKNLPEQGETEPEKMKERHREKEIIKKRLREICFSNTIIQSAMEESVKAVNGFVGDSQSFIGLHELLEKQAYRLSFWRVAGEEINYRRFFDINEMVALRIEDPDVFREIHRFLLDLYGRGLITGIRIDHVDGLFEPGGYLLHLQRDCWLKSEAQKLKTAGKISAADQALLLKQLTDKLNQNFEGKSSASLKPAYLVVEKILSENEHLNLDWPVEGTTGYEFMAALNQVFVDSKKSRKILDIYRRFIGSNKSFDDIVYDCKNLVMKTTLAGEVNMLAHRLNTVSEKSWQYRDFTLNSLRDAIRELIACFPVYRTYVNAYIEYISENDREVVSRSIMEAKRRNPAVSSEIFDFVRDTLCLKYPTGMDEYGRDEQRLFVMRFQQFTGPVMAKGVEDTAFYIYNPLVSLNEVGSNLRSWGTPIKEFHKQNILRRNNSPGSLIATSTHDSKRAEDVRARINVLAEIPGEWNSALARWSRLNKNKKLKEGGVEIPDRNDEYLLYQTLIGTCPSEKVCLKDFTSYRIRIQNYMLKALKEAKVHSSWISPNKVYESGTTKFIETILDTSSDNLFLSDFKRLNQVVAFCGVFNSLSQVVLKVFSPGVPDIYQGNELWTFSLTDPDNRTPVDYSLRIPLLDQMKKQTADFRDLKRFIKGLTDNPGDGRIKLYVTWKCLNYRKDNRDLFEGSYLPLTLKGRRRNHLCAFAWIKEQKMVIVAAPRFPFSLTHQATIKPLGETVWEDTKLDIPEKKVFLHFRNIFTGEPLENNNGSGHTLLASDVFKNFPVAVLETI